jgi:hypothetical protein
MKTAVLPIALILAVSLVVLAATGPAAAGVIVLSPSTTTLDDNGFEYPFQYNYGGDGNMADGARGGVLGYRDMFTLLDPANIAIDSASLRVYSNTTGESLTVSRITTPWLSLKPAGQAQFNVTGAYSDMANEVTWLTAPGENYAFGASDYTTVGATTTALNDGYNASTDCDVTAMVAAMFATGVNEGFFVQLQNSGYVRSSEYLGAELTINYHSIPEPATMSLLALGGLAMLRRRK